MRRRVQKTRRLQTEDEKLNAYMDRYGSNRPLIQIYRLDEDENNKGKRKQTRVGAMLFDERLDLESEVQRQFGGGTFLARTVRSNGTWGPSRVLRIASLS